MGPMWNFREKYLKASWIRTDMDKHLFRLSTHMEPGEGKILP